MGKLTRTPVVLLSLSLESVSPLPVSISLTLLLHANLLDPRPIFSNVECGIEDRESQRC